MFGAAAMIDGNEVILQDACRVALEEVGYTEDEHESGPE